MFPLRFSFALVQRPPFLPQPAPNSVRSNSLYVLLPSLPDSVLLIFQDRLMLLYFHGRV